MSKATITTLRLPESLLARADTLAETMPVDAGSTSGKLVRSQVLRKALELGLSALEAEHAQPKGRRR
jgi:hypothetical protein